MNTHSFVNKTIAFLSPKKIAMLQFLESKKALQFALLFTLLKLSFLIVPFNKYVLYTRIHVKKLDVGPN